MFTHTDLALSLLLLLVAPPPLLPPAPVLALPPSEGTPTFGDPTNISNAWAPFDPGSVRVFSGREDGERSTAVYSQLEQTRTFLLDGAPVACRILEEKDFLAGVLVEVSYRYLAQDDAGNVRSFGEVSWVYTDGTLSGAEQDSWLVGGATEACDPPGAWASSVPMMFMPAEPKLGDSFAEKDVPGFGETLTVVAVDLKVKVPAGKFTGAIKLQELDDGEDGNGKDASGFWWVVPGVGVVKEKAKGMRSELLATSQQAEVVEPTDAGGDATK